MVSSSRKRFVEAWGVLGGLLGFNPSTARVHALLIASDRALCLDEIAKALRISRGNASMCLKELRGWGVVFRSNRPGDRRDYFESESDAWKMGLAIANERMRRDVDPALAGVRAAIARVTERGPAALRLRRMDEFLGVMQRIAEKLVGDEAAASHLIELLAGPAPAAEER